MTRRVTTMRMAMVVAGLAGVTWAAPAVAQTTRPAAAAARQADADEERRPYSRWSLGLLSGAQQVERTGVTAGGELGVRLRKGIHLVVEGGWMSDVVTASRITEINDFAAYVRSAYTVPATGTIDGPTLFGLAGLKIMPDGKPAGQSSGVRPYAMLAAGIARVEYKPTFVVDGQPVSGAGIVLYNVQLGKDLLGTTNRFAYSGGAGVVFGDTWYLDLGVRVTRIHTTDHPTTVKRIAIGMGRRF